MDASAGLLTFPLVSTLALHPSQPVKAWAQHVLSLLPPPEAAQNSNTSAQHAQHAMPAASPATKSQALQQDWFEAVEIKNVCPFRELREFSSNGKAHRMYHLSDSGPYNRVSTSAVTLKHPGGLHQSCSLSKTVNVRNAFLHLSSLS